MSPVLAAMDYPNRDAPEDVGYLDAMNMSPEDKKQFFQLNAQKLFKIKVCDEGVVGSMGPAYKARRY